MFVQVRLTNLNYSPCQSNPLGTHTSPLHTDPDQSSHSDMSCAKDSRRISALGLDPLRIHTPLNIEGPYLCNFMNTQKHSLKASVLKARDSSLCCSQWRVHDMGMHSEQHNRTSIRMKRVIKFPDATGIVLDIDDLHQSSSMRLRFKQVLSNKNLHCKHKKSI